VDEGRLVAVEEDGNETLKMLAMVVSYCQPSERMVSQQMMIM